MDDDLSVYDPNLLMSDSFCIKITESQLKSVKKVDPRRNNSLLFLVLS